MFVRLYLFLLRSLVPYILLKSLLYIFLVRKKKKTSLVASSKNLPAHGSDDFSLKSHTPEPVSSDPGQWKKEENRVSESLTAVLKETELSAPFLSGLGTNAGKIFSLEKEQIMGLIGPNGAGKTTTLHTITGLLSPKKGQVIFEGKDITKVPAHKIVSMGMAHVPEGRRVFAELSVYENLKMGAYTRSDKNEIEESLANVYRRFPRLEERKNQMAGTLSGGEQQMLAMGRALMSKPKIILMDEPSMGLSPILVNEIFDIIRAVSESGTTVLLVEQNAKKALAIPDRAYVLETGKIVLEGNAKDLLEDDSIKKAYLGE